MYVLGQEKARLSIGVDQRHEEDRTEAHGGLDHQQRPQVHHCQARR